MPVKKVWLNLPVKDILKSKAFFNQMGFITEGEYGNSEFSCPVFIGENKFTVMLFTEEKFNCFSKNPLCNARESTEVLISLDAESREEVDDYARKATAAGGLVVFELHKYITYVNISTHISLIKCIELPTLHSQLFLF